MQHQLRDLTAFETVPTGIYTYIFFTISNFGSKSKCGRISIRLNRAITVVRSEDFEFQKPCRPPRPGCQDSLHSPKLSRPSTNEEENVKFSSNLLNQVFHPVLVVPPTLKIKTSSSSLQFSKLKFSTASWFVLLLSMKKKT